MVEKCSPLTASGVKGLDFLALEFNVSSRRVLHNKLALMLMQLISDIEAVQSDGLTMKTIATCKKRLAQLSTQGAWLEDAFYQLDDRAGGKSCADHAATHSTGPRHSVN